MSQTPRLPVADRLRRAGNTAWAVIGLMILVAIIGWLLYKIRIIFPPLALALLIIYLLNPLVSRLEARRVPRMVGSLLTYVVVLGGLVLIVIGLSSLVGKQVSEFADEWPVYRVEIAEFVEETAAGFEDRFGVRIETKNVSCLLGADEAIGDDVPTPAECDEVTQRFRRQIAHSAGRITEIGFSVLEGLLVFILAPLLALYLLIDLPQLQRDILNLVPESHRVEAADLGNKVGRAVGGFFRGQFMVAIIVGVLSAIGFRLIGLPFWLLIGSIAGLFNLIPLVGPFVGGFAGFLVGTISGGVGLGLKAALVEVVVQQIDNHIISPNVMRRTVELHPVTVMLSILAGGALAGFWGVLLGVPTVAVAKILLGHIWSTRVLGVEVSPQSETVPGEPPTVVPQPET